MILFFFFASYTHKLLFVLKSVLPSLAETTHCNSGDSVILLSGQFEYFTANGSLASFFLCVSNITKHAGIVYLIQPLGACLCKQLVTISLNFSEIEILLKHDIDAHII